MFRLAKNTTPIVQLMTTNRRIDMKKCIGIEEIIVNEMKMFRYGNQIFLTEADAIRSVCKSEDMRLVIDEPSVDCMELLNTIFKNGQLHGIKL